MKNLKKFLVSLIIFVTLLVSHLNFISVFAQDGNSYDDNKGISYKGDSPNSILDSQKSIGSVEEIKLASSTNVPNSNADTTSNTSTSSISSASNSSDVEASNSAYDSVLRSFKSILSFFCELFKAVLDKFTGANRDISTPSNIDESNNSTTASPTVTSETTPISAITSSQTSEPTSTPVATSVPTPKPTSTPAITSIPTQKPASTPTYTPNQKHLPSSSQDQSNRSLSEDNETLRQLALLGLIDTLSGGIGSGSTYDSTGTHPDGFGSDGYFWKGGRPYYYAGQATPEEMAQTGNTGFGYINGITKYIYNGSVYRLAG